MKKLNKKGSHVGFVLSFLIFIVALVFIYLIIISAIPKSETKENSLLLLEKNVLNKISSDVWVIRAYGSGTGGSCISILKPALINNGVSIAFNDSGSIASSVSGNDLFVEGGAGAMKIYYSDSIYNTNLLALTGCSQISPDSVKKEKKFLENKIVDLMSNFSGNYSALKNELEVPSEMDFDLYFEYGNSSTIGKIRREPNTEVYSANLNIYYLSTDNSNKQGKLRVKIW